MVVIPVRVISLISSLCFDIPGTCIYKTFFHFADNKLLVVNLKYNLGQ